MDKQINVAFRLLLMLCTFWIIYLCMAAYVKNDKTNPQGDCTTLRELLGINVFYVDFSSSANTLQDSLFDRHLTGVHWSYGSSLDFQESPLYSFSILYRNKPNCSKIFPLLNQCDIFESEDRYYIRINYITHSDGEGFYGFYLIDE